MKTAELTGALLDYWVARAEGLETPRMATRTGYEQIPGDPVGCRVGGGLGFAFQPSTNWAQGGPIVEREGIALKLDKYGLWHGEIWRGRIGDADHLFRSECGKTHLEAAMRAYVSIKFCDTVPDEVAA